MLVERRDSSSSPRSDATRDLSAFVASPGDLVLAADHEEPHGGRSVAGTAGEPATPDREPVGEVERVLETSHGVRLVVQRAFFRGRFVVVAADDIEQAGTDRLGLRWIRLRVALPTLLARGTYRRVMGRLARDPEPLPLPPAPADDAAVRAELGTTLAAHPLLADSELTLHVTHGVAVIDGWVRTVGAKVASERIARETRGIWAVRNRLLSDEELLAAARRQLTAVPDLARAISELRLDLGRAALVLRHDTPPEVVAAAERVMKQLPGLREVTIIG